VPYSVDETVAYISAREDSIHVVHCYSMRNGLFGSVREARVIWSAINFDVASEYRVGSAQDYKTVSFEIAA